ncbi:hypothetical protein QFC22_003515 [Naganishia vaughanmartiniae]|uniref:Uncharacterized protein n=1 Tax=Naganishia vaughanmartiniae TaxID=1424756 RepID=A0ACC2X6H1_9TREE|nr:hypothetical protein QFC22_003515 [Naganishia vaughanmartiniae]
MSSVNLNEQGDSDTDTPRAHRIPVGEHDRTDFTPIATTTTTAAAGASSNALDVSAPTHDPSHTSQSLYSNRLRSHHRYQDPNSAAGLPTNLQSFPSSSASTSASHYITRLPPPIGLAESPLNQYRVLNRLAARPPSGTAGSVGSVSRAGSGYGAEESGLTPSHSHRQSATGIPLRSSLDDRGFRPPSSSSAHFNPELPHQHPYHLPIPNSTAVGNTSYQGLPPSGFGINALQDRRPSTASGIAAFAHNHNLPYSLSSPAHSQSGYSPVQLPPPNLPASTGGFQTRPQSAREQNLDLPRPSFASSTTSTPWDAYSHSLNQQHRQSWQSTGSAGGHRLSYGPQQSQPYFELSGSSSASTAHRLPPQLNSASISSYDFEADYPHYHNQQLRSAGVPPTLSYPGIYTERSSVGSAYASRPQEATNTAARQEGGPQSNLPLEDVPIRERYPTPELVYYTEGNGNVVHPGSRVSLDGIANKKRRFSGTQATGSSNSYHHRETNQKEGFVADWSYPTLAPVTSSLSQPTSPRGTVQPFSYAFSEPENPLYLGYPAGEPPSEDRVQRFNRLCAEEKRDIEARRKRQLVGPDSEATFRQSLKRLTNEVTGVPYSEEDKGEYRCRWKVAWRLWWLTNRDLVDRLQFTDNGGINNNNNNNNDPSQYIDTMPTRRASPGGQMTQPSSQTSNNGPSNSARLTRAAAAAAQQHSQPGSVAPSMQSSRPSMSSYRYSNGGLAGNSAGLPSGGYMMNALAMPGGTGRSTRARVYREIIGGKEQSIYGVEDETPAPLPGTTGGQQKRKASSNAASLRSTATYNGAMAGNGMLPNGYHLPTSHLQQAPAQSKRRKPDDGYGYYRAWDERPSAAGSVRTNNGKAGTAGSTTTQSTVNTGVGINLPPDRHHNPPSTGHYGSHYIPEQRDNYYPSNTKSYNQSKAQVMPPSRPAYHAPQYALPAEHAAPRMAQAQPQQIAQAPSQSSQGTDSGAPTCDDKDGHYIVTPGSYFGPQHKFRIIRLLGQGTFGKVVEATERGKSLHKVAVKIIRAVPKYREAAGIEIRVLRTLRDNDPENTHKCIHLLDTFDWRNHICLVTPLYGQSVFDFLKENKFQPFPEKHIQSFAASLLDSLKFLHRLNLIHTDLKPENILLVSNAYYQTGERRANAKGRHILRDTEIRLIDFGSATFDNEFHSSVVSTRHYRAPEIILGLGWSFPCDLFSVGCILVEFYTGDALFQTHDNLEHLAMMEVVMGKMPLPIANRAWGILQGQQAGLPEYPDDQAQQEVREGNEAFERQLNEVILSTISPTNWSAQTGNHQSGSSDDRRHQQF